MVEKKIHIFIEELDAESFSLMKDFCSFYKRLYGDPFKDNWLYKNVVMFTLMKIWVKNKDSFDESEMMKCFKPIEKIGSIKQDSFVGDLATLENLTRKIYRVINKGRSVNKFERFWEEN